AIVIIPGIVEEGHALVDGGVHDLDGFLGVLDSADVPAAKAENGDIDAGLAERPGRQALAAVVCGGNGRSQANGSSAGQCVLQEFASSAAGLLVHCWFLSRTV